MSTRRHSPDNTRKSSNHARTCCDFCFCSRSTAVYEASRRCISSSWLRSCRQTTSHHITKREKPFHKWIKSSKGLHGAQPTPKFGSSVAEVMARFERKCLQGRGVAELRCLQHRLSSGLRFRGWRNTSKETSTDAQRIQKTGEESGHWSSRPCCFTRSW
jgi:hypothetical protein